MKGIPHDEIKSSRLPEGLSRMSYMSANRDELHDLIDGLPDDQVAAVLADVKRRTTPRPPRTTEPFAWFGMIKDGPTDASSPEAIDAALAQGFGR
jgi:hypothetical protein